MVLELACVTTPDVDAAAKPGLDQIATGPTPDGLISARDAHPLEDPPRVTPLIDAAPAQITATIVLPGVDAAPSVTVTEVAPVVVLWPTCTGVGTGPPA